MNLMENIRLAVEGLRANKMRALLTMLGIIIGIGSVIAILTVGNGMSGVITDTMNSFGGSNIGISLRERDEESIPGMGFSRVYSGVEAPEADNLITDDMIRVCFHAYHIGKPCRMVGMLHCGGLACDITDYG